MREIDSFHHFERLIYQESWMDGKEKLFLTNGRLFMEIGTNGDNEGVYVDIAKETEFLDKYQGIFVYSYHTHIKNVRLNRCPQPPSFDDFCVDKRFRERAKKRGKRIVSRILEKNGVWQYSCNSNLLPPINLDEMIQYEIECGNTLKERVDRLIKGYMRFGVSEIKFYKRRI